MITGSITGAIVYDMMNQKEIERQARQANAYYSAAVNSSMNKNLAEADAKTLRYFFESFYPAMISAVALVFEELFNRYIAVLANAKIIDIACVAEIDESKAEKIINNFSLQREENKKAVFIQAIKLCPYSESVYLTGYKDYLNRSGLQLKDVCGEIIKYFGLETELHDVLVSVDTLCEEARAQLFKKNYDGAEKLYSQVKELYPKDHRGYLGMLLVETWGFTKQTADQGKSEVLYNSVLSLNPNKEKNAILTEYFTQYEETVKYLKANQEVDEGSVNSATWRVSNQKFSRKTAIVISSIMFGLGLLFFVWAILAQPTNKFVIGLFCVAFIIIAALNLRRAISANSQISALQLDADNEKEKLNQKRIRLEELKKAKDVSVLF